MSNLYITHHIQTSHHCGGPRRRSFWDSLPLACLEISLQPHEAISVGTLFFLWRFLLLRWPDALSAVRHQNTEEGKFRRRISTRHTSPESRRKDRHKSTALVRISAARFCRPILRISFLRFLPIMRVLHPPRASFTFLRPFWVGQGLQHGRSSSELKASIFETMQTIAMWSKCGLYTL